MLWAYRQRSAGEMCDICRISHNGVVEQMLPTVRRRIGMTFLPSLNVFDYIQPLSAQFRHVAEQAAMFVAEEADVAAGDLELPQMRRDQLRFRS